MKSQVDYFKFSHFKCGPSVVVDIGLQKVENIYIYCITLPFSQNHPNVYELMSNTTHLSLTDFDETSQIDETVKKY